MPPVSLPLYIFNSHPPSHSTQWAYTAQAHHAETEHSKRSRRKLRDSGFRTPATKSNPSRSPTRFRYTTAANDVSDGIYIYKTQKHTTDIKQLKLLIPQKTHHY